MNGKTAGLALCLLLGFAAQPALGDEVIWDIDFYDDAGKTIGEGSFSYDPDTTDTIACCESGFITYGGCGCVSDWNSFPDQYGNTCLTGVNTRLETFDVTVAGANLSGIPGVYWDGRPDYHPIWWWADNVGESHYPAGSRYYYEHDRDIQYMAMAKGAWLDAEGYGYGGRKPLKRFEMHMDIATDKLGEGSWDMWVYKGADAPTGLSGPHWQIASDEYVDYDQCEYTYWTGEICGLLSAGGTWEARPRVEQLDHVAIDIRPFFRRNYVIPNRKANIWVAVLADPESMFDPVLEVDTSTLRFGPGGATVKSDWSRDVNRDGWPDLLLRFRVRHTGIAYGDTEATLTGETFDGASFAATDTIRTVGWQCWLKRRTER